MWALTYPAWVPVAAQRQLTLALQDADAAIAATQPVDLVVTVDLTGGPDRPADSAATCALHTAARDGALALADEVLTTLDRVVARHPWKPDQLEQVRVDIEDLLAQSLLAVYEEYLSSTIPRADFLADLGESVRGRPSWMQLQTTLRSCVQRTAVVRKARARAPRDISHLKAERERVVLPLLDQLEWTPTRWAAEAGVNPHTAIDYLKGTSTLRTGTRKQVTYALATALKQPKLRLPD